MNGRSGASSWSLAYGIVTLAALVRLVLAAIIPVVPDEAYYWEWSRHLAAGYFDHPPALAWAIRGGVLLAGTTPLGVRLLPVVAGWGASLAIVAMAGRLGGGRTAWWAAVIASCVPLAAAGLVLATPDSLLLAGVAATLAATLRAVEAAPGSAAAVRWWLIAGVALGASMLSKYPAVLVPLGVVVALAVHPRLRSQFTTWGPYLAVAVAAALFLPAVAWNARHHWVSFGFQLHHGLGAPRGSALAREGALVGGQLVLVSPVLFVMMAVAIAGALREGAERRRFLLAVVAAVIFIFFLVSALRRPAEANWQAPAYVPGIVLLALAGGGVAWTRWLTAGCAIAAAMVAVIYVQSVVPVLPIAARTDPTARGAGWGALARRVEAVRDSISRAAPGSRRVWVGANRYQEASELAFHLAGHPQTFSFNVASRRNQYDLWPSFFARARAGDDLLLVTESSSGVPPVLGALSRGFAHVSSAGVVALHRGNALVRRQTVWVLTGWRGRWRRPHRRRLPTAIRAPRL